jgi:acyl-CoA thioester hydrolase
MPTIFEYPHTVAAGEMDELGHANNQVYLAWLNAAALAHSTVQGWSQEAYVKAGAGWVVRKHEIEYLAPARVGETLIVRTWVATMARATSLRRYEIVRPKDGARLAVASTLWAFVDYKTLRPKRIPEQVARAFHVVPDRAAP